MPVTLTNPMFLTLGIGLSARASGNVRERGFSTWEAGQPSNAANVQLLVSPYIYGNMFDSLLSESCHCGIFFNGS